MDSREGFLLEAGIGRSVHAESMVNQSIRFTQTVGVTS